MTPRVLLITDPAFADDVIVRCIEAAAAALPAGALCVQLRDKSRARTSLRLFACRLRIVTRKLGASLVVNGSPCLARDAGADGVHLGARDGRPGEARSIVGRRIWVSVAAHSDNDVREAVRDQADAVLVSPVFATRSPSLHAPGLVKPGRGLDAIRNARALSVDRVAVFALGGITPERAGPCAAAGADGVAIMKALLASPTPGAVAAAIRDAFARG